MRQSSSGWMVDGTAVSPDIDEATLKGYPEVVYGEARKQGKNKKLGASTTCTCCSVCLDNYDEGDVLQVLPDCGHLFHRECVDPWLRRHPTCPVCRTSPLPNPMPSDFMARGSTTTPHRAEIRLGAQARVQWQQLA
ncbi:putative RING-H2 finger protein ATL71 [Brachypodium distachyon]|uniref:putative RING-H2 finger protein ATL71 n=1 Tax=Brachypodium distachyon TaxID=15368 RepID=UPI00052FDF5B|nr:putative RING-H2 finger protein ATL71 [Brachypodium distachyon]|eukprot:XP_010229606.1 putative RING-H2 finger protein ATL71 [Brachypodium distachyon]